LVWKIELTRESKKQLGKLDRVSAKRIRDYLRRQVEPASDPRGMAKPLKGRFATLWRLRVGDYRLICDIRDNDLLILVVRISHRKQVYRTRK